MTPIQVHCCIGKRGDITVLLHMADCGFTFRNLKNKGEITMILYALNKVPKIRKRLIAKGKLTGRQLPKSITVAQMSEEDYQAMVGPLFAIFRNKRKVGR